MNTESFTVQGNELLTKIKTIQTTIERFINNYKSNQEPNQEQISQLGNSVTELLNSIKRIQDTFRKRVESIIGSINKFNNNPYIKKGLIGRGYRLVKLPPILKMDNILASLSTAVENKAVRNKSAANAREAAAATAAANRRKTAATSALQRLLNQLKGARKNVNGSNGVNNGRISQ